MTKHILQNAMCSREPPRDREITDADKPYYFKDRNFDEEAWAKINGK
ncbi:MAG: hypothetical protein V8Q93_08215 [Blautia faecis]